MKKAKPKTNPAKQVDAFIEELDHPFKEEVQMIREIIKSVNQNITEQIKWNAPSFSYQGEYLATFNLRAKEHIHLIFHNPEIARVKSSLLEGDYKDRRMAYFLNRDDIQMKKPGLQKALTDLIKLQNKAEESK